MTFKLTLHIVAENSSSCNFKEASRLGRLYWLMQISLFSIHPQKPSESIMNSIMVQTYSLVITSGQKLDPEFIHLTL